MNHGFSVILPTYNMCHFIRRAVLSLQKQTMKDYELIIVDDGSTDSTATYLDDIINTANVTYIRNDENMGLGYALNQGLAAAKYEFIAYLPADDYYDAKHLENFQTVFEDNPNCVLAFSGMRYDMNDTLCGVSDVSSASVRKGYGLQLVQTAHRNIKERWVERSEWISDDLFAMFWRKLADKGTFISTGEISCFWTQHPWQRHKLISEKYGGGLNKVRSYYHIKTPIKLKVAKEKFTDEHLLYSDFRKRCEESATSLKILLVGELAYNPERIYALEQAGHRLYGLWMPMPNLSFSTVGPLPFWNVIDITSKDWQEEVRKINPDIAYGLLNWGAIGWCCEVMKALPELPFAWHFKEGPYLSIRTGNFADLIYLYHNADLKIYLNKEVRQWFEMFIPHSGLTMLMDGDLPKRDYFKDCFSEKLSARDGEIHTVVAGRMIGLWQNDIAALAQEGIHIHLYLENFHASREKLIDHYQRTFPKYFHIHHHCPPTEWTREFSKYDAGWLHCVNSKNSGNIIQATWDDLNYPARMSTYMAAGLPMLKRGNAGNIVASEACINELGIGITFSDLADLVKRLKDKATMAVLKDNVMCHRDKFCFDHYVPELVSKFREAIKQKTYG